MDFKQFLQKQAQIINLRLVEILGKTSGEVGKISPDLVELFEKFSESSKDGKRIRGALVLLGYEVAGGKEPDKIIDAAAAFEIFQTAILAQDDIIDKSTTRRSKPSLYSSLGGDHKAISQTICLSDLGFFKSFDLLNSLEIDSSLKIKAIDLFSRILSQTVLGEMLDIEAPFLKRDFLEEDSLKISLLKTAAYTISGPLLLGATLAGANPETLKELKGFGGNLGIAFQIQDDILGVFGQEKRTGKSNLDDIKECKATLLIAYAQKYGNLEQRKVLEKYYGNPEIEDENAQKIKKVFTETKALDFAKSKTEEYFNKAKESLKEINRGLLYSLVEFLEKRDF